MLQYDFEDSIGFLVFIASHAIEQSLNEELRPHGITFRQWQVLAAIGYLGENASQGDIADRLGIESATLVGVLDRMERDGWIRRHPCPTDRRKKLVKTTDRVEPVWETMVECGHRVRQRALEGIGQREFQGCWKVLERLVNNLDGMPARQQPA